MCIALVYIILYITSQKIKTFFIYLMYYCDFKAEGFASLYSSHVIL